MSVYEHFHECKVAPSGILRIDFKSGRHQNIQLLFRGHQKAKSVDKLISVRSTAALNGLEIGVIELSMPFLRIGVR